MIFGPALQSSSSVATCTQPHPRLACDWQSAKTQLKSASPPLPLQRVTHCSVFSACCKFDQTSLKILFPLSKTEREERGRDGKTVFSCQSTNRQNDIIWSTIRIIGNFMCTCAYCSLLNTVIIFFAILTKQNKPVAIQCIFFHLKNEWRKC